MRVPALRRYLVNTSLGALACLLLAMAFPARLVRAPDSLGVETATLIPPTPAVVSQALPPGRRVPRPTPAAAQDHAAPDIQSYSLHLPYIDTSAPPSLGDLSSDWILMVDDTFIASRNVMRRYYPFQKFAGNPILQARKPWEGSIIQLYGTVFNGFRMWYMSYNQELRLGQALYAESGDGIQWRKPDLPHQSGNILFNGRPAEIISVLHTPHDPARLYKAVVYQNGAFWGYWSPDGIEMIPVSENPLWSNGEDVAHFSWNASTHRYEAAAKEIISINTVWRRAIRILVSDDFVHWVPLPELFAPDEQDDLDSPGFFTHFYGMPTFNLGRQRLGLLWILNARNALGLHGPVFVQLASSSDGVRWQREEGSRPPILDVGPPGAWDSGQVYTASHPIKVGSELWLYYSGCNREHGEKAAGMSCSIGLATIPYLRLASLEGTGEVLSRPVNATGKGLRLNYDATQGEIRVELQRDGAALPGYEAENCIPLTGDSLDALVVWKDQASFPDGPFQVRFVLQNAKVFAFTP